MSPHSIVYLPLVLLAIDKLQGKFRRFYFLTLVFSVCISIFAGYLQTTIYLLVLAFFYLLYRAKSLNLELKFYARTISGILMGIIISFIQLLPSVELFFNSQRSGVDFSSVVKSYLLPPISLITYLAPDFFGNPATRNHFLGGNAQYYEAILFVGIAPLLFSFFSLIKKRDSLVIFFTASAVISLLIVVDSFFSRFFVSLPIPLVLTAIPHRILFVPAFSFAVLGAIGLDFWMKNKKVSLAKTIAFFVFLFVCIFVYLAYEAGYFSSAVSFTPELGNKRKEPGDPSWSICAYCLYNNFHKKQKVSGSFNNFSNCSQYFLFFQKIFILFRKKIRIPEKRSPRIHH